MQHITGCLKSNGTDQVADDLESLNFACPKNILINDVMQIFTSLSHLLRLLQQCLVSKSASFCIEMRKKRHSGEKSKQRVFDK